VNTEIRLVPDGQTHAGLKVARVPSAAELEGRLSAEGYQRGVPCHIYPATRRAVARMAGKMRCPCCATRGLMVQSFKRGSSWRCLAVCAVCHSGEEV
jgi:hypothetical protein